MFIIRPQSVSKHLPQKNFFSKSVVKFYVLVMKINLICFFRRKLRHKKTYLLPLFYINKAKIKSVLYSGAKKMGTNLEDVNDLFSPPWFNVSIPIVYGSAYKKTFCLTNRANDVVPVYIYINIIQFLLCCDVLHLVFIGSLVWFQNADYVSLHRI